MTRLLPASACEAHNTLMFICVQVPESAADNEDDTGEDEEEDDGFEI